MQRTLVTGATGFIGEHLVRRLYEDGHRISCLVRATSDRRQLLPFDPEFVVGDVTDPASLERAIGSVDVVYHLAGATKGLNTHELQSVNVDGVRHVTRCCANCANPPTLIVVSSIAAGGPTPANRLRIESDEPSPVSNYGRSKLGGEREAMRWADDVPITIIRPPIVLGEADRDGLSLFESIARWNLHFVAGMSDELFSVIHGDDLAAALVLATQKGRRLRPDHPNDGVYYATSGETPTYAELGRMIGEAVGREKIHIIHNPKPAVWAIAAINELASQIRRKPHFLGIDKAREATAGSWACDGSLLRHDTGFAAARPLRQRLAQTVQWYCEQGWLTTSA